MALEGAKGINAPVHEALPSMAEGDIVPQMQDFATIGHLYRSIEQGLALRGRLAEVLATPPPALRRLRRHPRTLIGVATAERRDEPYAWQQSTGAGADHTKTAPDGPQQAGLAPAGYSFVCHCDRMQRPRRRAVARSDMAAGSRRASSSPLAVWARGRAARYRCRWVSCPRHGGRRRCRGACRWPGRSR
jgi:hypothetical protein